MEKELTSTEELDCESRFLTGRIKYDSKEEIYLLSFCSSFSVWVKIFLNNNLKIGLVVAGG